MSTQQPPLSLHRLTFVSTLNQDLAADYLAHLRTRHYSPKTLQTTLGALITFLQEQGLLAHHPIHPRRHAVLLPQMLPRPMAEDDLIRFFQVIDALRAAGGGSHDAALVGHRLDPGHHPRQQ